MKEIWLFSHRKERLPETKAQAGYSFEPATGFNFIVRIFMKELLALALCAFICTNAFATDVLPKFYDNISIAGIEAWPNAGNLTYGYMVRVIGDLSSTGCDSPHIFSVMSGDFQDETFSVLLAAMLSGKKIRVRVVECSDRPLVDRVEIRN